MEKESQRQSWKTGQFEHGKEGREGGPARGEKQKRNNDKGYKGTGKERESVGQFEWIDSTETDLFSLTSSWWWKSIGAYSTEKDTSVT